MAHNGREIPFFLDISTFRGNYQRNIESNLNTFVRGIGAAIASILSYMVTGVLILGFFNDTRDFFKIFLRSFSAPTRLFRRYGKKFEKKLTRIRIVVLQFFASTKFGSSLYYFLFSREFSREHQSCIAGKN